jgi:type VI secretion system protein ImpL
MRLFGLINISPRRLWRYRAFRWLVLIVAIGAILAAVWYGFPMTGIGFLAEVWVRATVIGVILALILIPMFVRWLRRRSAARRLEESLIPEPVGDGKVIAERMQEALGKLKKSGGKTYLYDLPWYIIIGPPGAGKTTALRNSGIEFPGSEALANGTDGFGGTRNCDWWFAEDAVLIDTAGRYTTQDSDGTADKASWTAFLETLKRGRPNQPINGVILSFSVADMMGHDAAALDRHAQTVRARLSEIHEVLKIDFPVYVLFTKADLIAGFREYFSSFNVSRRKAVWGTTFQTRDRAAPTHTQVEAEFDRLVSRLSDEVVDRMSEEPDSVSRISIFGLPSQMALLRADIAEFLRKVFEPTRYKSNAILRGFYFTSGTQEGTPIDQVLGVMARNQDDGMAFQPAFLSGRGKSYFLHDLLKKVIFEESDWVSHDARAVRRSAILRTLATSLIVLVTMGAMAGLGWSFWRNATMARAAESDANAYYGQAQEEIRREVINDTEFSLVLPHLDLIRSMTTGFGDPTRPDLIEGLGLGQYGRLSSASARAYSDALERMMRPRLILHLENAIPQLIADQDTAGVYRALKVYILLGGQQEGAPDEAAVASYFSEVWAGEFPSAGQLDERDALEAHVTAMLQLDDDRSPTIAIDPEIVRSAREVIVNLPLAEQAYASIKDRAALSGLEDFNLVERVSGQVEDVLTTNDGSVLTELGVPALFTFDGYWQYFLEELTQARQRLEADQWVLGEAASRVGYETQLAGLERDLHRLYQQDFEAAWFGMLDRVAIAAVANDAPNFDRLAILSSPVGSPLLDLVEAVDTETRLTRLFDAMADVTPEQAASGGLGDAMAKVGFRQIEGQSSAMQRVMLNWVRDRAKVQDRSGAVAEDSQERQVQRITDAFENWHLLLRGEEGARPIDAVLKSIADLRDNRRLAATSPTPVDDTLLQQLLSTLTRNNTALPKALATLMTETEVQFREVAENATLTELNRALNDEVSQYCDQFIASYYPFDGTRHLATNVFGEFFGPGGRMDSFYSSHLQPYVTRTSDGLQPVTGNSIGDRLSPAALKQFDRAEAIRAAFFGSGSTEPSVKIYVTLVSSSNKVEMVNLIINGTSVRTLPGEAPTAIDWPGEGIGASIELFPTTPGRESRFKVDDGRWDIVEFLRKGRANPQGSTVTVGYEVGGRAVNFRFDFESTTVPFLMPELSDFSCPTSLD